MKARDVILCGLAFSAWTVFSVWSGYRMGLRVERERLYRDIDAYAQRTYDMGVKAGAQALYNQLMSEIDRRRSKAYEYGIGTNEVPGMVITQPPLGPPLIIDWPKQ